MKRREFIAGLGGAAAWPTAARAQQSDRVRRVAALTDAGTFIFKPAFREELARLGWIEAHNLQFDEIRTVGFGNRGVYVAELMNLRPEVIIAVGGGNTLAVREKTQTIPIVSIGAGDVFGRIVKNIARPEGNITGVSSLFSSFGGKWLELLKEAVPRLERVAYIKAPPPFTDFFPSIAEAARVLTVQAIEISYRNSVDIVRGVDAFAVTLNGGLIVPPASLVLNQETILTLGAEHRLPTVVGSPLKEGALICYGPNIGDLLRRGAVLVDRILHGAEVSELPVEFPTKFELIINLKNARTLGLEVPTPILLRADEVIE
jgi:putative tryptophan/tyrosine transport system substrate-binding protein